jgi:hypothetical protein
MAMTLQQSMQLGRAQHRFRRSAISAADEFDFFK